MKCSFIRKLSSFLDVLNILTVIPAPGQDLEQLISQIDVDYFIFLFIGIIYMLLFDLTTIWWERNLKIWLILLLIKDILIKIGMRIKNLENMILL